MRSSCFLNNQRQHRTIVSADLVGPFAPTVQFGNFEIHPVFLRFPNFHLEQNGSPSSLAKLCGVALSLQKSKFLLNFFTKKFRGPGAAPRSPAAAGETPAGRSQRNARPAHGAESPIVPKRHPQMAQSPQRSRKAAVPTPSRVADGGLLRILCFTLYII